MTGSGRPRAPVGRDPYRAWANFEFIADDGSLNEVDLLLLDPRLYRFEIKSCPGHLGEPEGGAELLPPRREIAGGFQRPGERGGVRGRAVGELKVDE